MKAAIYISVIVAAVSLVIGIIARAAGAAVGPMALQAPAFLQFANTCLLIAITLILLQLLKSKQ